MSGSRTANLTGALALTLSDRLQEAAAIAARHGGSAPAALATLLTYRDRKMTIMRLSQVIGLSHSATVRLIDQLARDGLVDRRPGADQREVALRLTPDGIRRARRILVEREVVLGRALERLGPAEVLAFDKIAEKVLAAITAGRREARWICRLCDHAACNEGGRCPVDAAATARGE
jgi:DNA-binding MarR family transcriptional regulator